MRNLNRILLSLLVALSSGIAFAGPGKVEVNGATTTMSFFEDSPVELVEGEKRYALKAMSRKTINELGLDFTRYKLVGVSVYSKSRKGKGTATLRVGSDMDSMNIPQSKGPFKKDRPKSFSLIEWDIKSNPGQHNEAWQLFLSGKAVKMESVHVHLQKKQRSSHLVKVPANKNGVADFTIFLRALLINNGVKLKGANLVKVVAQAKSIQANHQAKLMLGDRQADRQLIPRGGPGDGNEIFHWISDHPGTFNRVVFTPRPQLKTHSEQTWQIHLSTSTKFRSLKITIEK